MWLKKNNKYRLNPSPTFSPSNRDSEEVYFSSTDMFDTDHPTGGGITSPKLVSTTPP